MKKNSLILSIGMACLLSCAAISFSPKEYTSVNAENVTDLGEMNFTVEANMSSASPESGVFVLSDTTNAFPYTTDWEKRLFSTEAHALVFNGIDITNRSTRLLVKHGPMNYFIAVGDVGYSTRNEGDTITIKGNWGATVNGVTYTVYINPFSCVWDGTKWVDEFVVPELETYDKVSLTQAGIDDFSNEKINTEDFKTSPGAWNTFALSEDNTTNSFSFEFAFESFSDMQEEAFNVRIGNRSWDSGHYFIFYMCNSWNTNAGGVAILREKDGNTILNQSGDLPCNLQPGARHIIEFGAIRVKDENKNYIFVKYDGQYLYQIIKPVYTEVFYPRVGLFYGLNGLTNIFVGTTMPEQKEATDTLTFESGNQQSGIFLFGPENDIPVKSDWATRGAPVSKYNVLRNGEPLYTSRGFKSNPLVKHGAQNYYLNFSDDYSFTFSEGDIVTLENEFHFYENDTVYTMSFHPFAAEFIGGTFTNVSNIYSRLLDKLTDRYVLDDYDDDKVITIQGLLSQASTAFNNATSMKDLWDKYYSYMSQLDQVPLNEEKAAERLRQAKEAAINELNAYVDEDLYEAAQLEVVAGYVNSAIEQINAATSVEQVRQIVENTKALIASVETKQDVIEQKIMALEEGYEQYLAKYDVATITDLSAIGDVHIYPKDSEQAINSYSTDGNRDAFHSHIAAASDNEDGNMVFKFKYSSTNPKSREYDAQLFIRLRGTASNNYIFSIGANIDNVPGVRMGVMKDNETITQTIGTYAANFVANTEYVIECGAVDLKDYNRTFIYMKIDGEFVARKIVNPITAESKPSVIIMDSYTAANSNETATLSAVEEGTTKLANSTLLGRLILDNSSNSETLKGTLRDNNLDSGIELYPIQNGAVTINGNPINQNRSNARLVKSSGNKYSVLIAYPVSDGDVVHIGGLFSYEKTGSSFKNIVRLFDIDFTYHAGSDNWTQSAPSLEVAKIEAKETLSSYANLDDYTEANQALIAGIVETYSSRIDNATSVEQVYSILEEALAEIDAISTILDDYKKAAKAELTAYKSPELFRQNEVNELNRILTQAFASIDNCNDTLSVDVIVANAKTQIDGLKTAAQYDAEELASFKRAAKAEIEAYVGLLELNRYSDENTALISQLAMKARSDVDNATSQEEVQRIVDTFKQAIKEVKTNDGSTFDGEKYIEKGAKKGCGGSLIASSLIISVIALCGMALLLKKKHLLMFK